MAWYSAAAASFSAASWAERKRRERCWFIFARGATPSTAIMSSLRGRTMFTTRSVYSKMAIIISSSLAGGGRSSGCEHGCTMPFMSRYRLSISSPFGFGSRASMGILVFVPSSFSISSGNFSITGLMIFGYFLLSQRKSAGTPMTGGHWSVCDGIKYMRYQCNSSKVGCSTVACAVPSAGAARRGSLP
ncbi:hypothetical protein BAUCODRAFT_199760 [Baudoinia panamericana UAMH 10762]|uniref:Uncharacterized protein n=1 Tax=Baudoinia panamericana (strain UAMH 10762) TaxID=717646 RepID=M2M252_BAUPA|nr:uncharacterized protein BAUCODRAFT_199760 [Baudoinia panamericana UAMH 10762]EMD01168.1 hypothetical protein BAUCODRAFT_199760 [Baudoinia panamericana UAMH 10762]